MGLEFGTSLDESQSFIRYSIINIVCQTLLYGIYFCLVPIAVHVMVTNGLQGRLRKWFLAIAASMFALSTAYWVLSVVFTFILVDSWDSSVRACFSNDDTSSCILSKVAAIHISAAAWLVMFDAILFVNYIIADSVIVWRAWVLCFDQSRVVFMIPIVMLAINIVIYLMTVTMRVTMLISEEGSHMGIFLDHMLDDIRLVHQALSLSISISTTCIMTFKVWKYRKLLMESRVGVRTLTKAIWILAALIESGIIYILIGVASLTSITISLHVGLREVSNIFTPVGIQLVGIYPIIVILIVEQKRSLSSVFGTITTDAPGGRPSQTEHMRSALGPVLASGGRMDLATNSRDTDIHITLNPTFELGDIGIGAGSSESSKERHAVS